MKRKVKTYSISHKIIKVPLLLFFLLLVGFLAILWFHRDHFFFTSYHQDRILTSINDKKDAIDNWFNGLKKDFETSADVITKHYKTTIINEEQKQTKNSNKKSPPPKPTFQEHIHRIIKEKEDKGFFNFLSLISKEGKIIASTSTDLVGSDISETDIFKNILSKIKETTFVGFWKDGNKEYEVDIISPIKDGEGNTIAFLHGIVNLKPLHHVITTARLMSYEIVDKDGYIILASNPINKAMKYSGQFTNNLDRLSLFDNSFIAVVRLKELNLYLIQKTDLYYALYPFIEVCSIILGFFIFIILIFIYQSVVIKRQLLTPLNRIIGFIKSSSVGLQNVKPKGNFPKEIGNLIDVIDNAIFDVTQKDAEKEMIKMENPKTEVVQVKSDNSVSEGENIPSALRDSLSKIRLQSSAITERLTNIENKDEDHITLKKELFTLINLIDTIMFFLNDDADKREFVLSEVLNEIDNTVKALNLSPFIELIVEHDSESKDKIIVGSKDAIVQVIKNLLTSSLNATERGTVTIISSLIEDDDGQQRIIINISDTGYGYEASELESIKSGDVKGDLSLLWAFMIAEINGINLSIDSKKGKGTTATVVINTRY